MDHTLLLLDHINTESVLYPKDVLQKSIDDLKDKVLFGTIGYVPNSDLLIDESNAAFKVSRIHIDGNIVIGSITVLETLSGSKLQKMVLDNGLSSITFRPVGTFKTITESSFLRVVKASITGFAVLPVDQFTALQSIIER